MGVWGPNIYQDDLAEEVRDYYKDQLHRGKKGTDITQELLSQYRNALSDSEDASVFWFALADTQWDLGRLEETVKKQALKYIENGSGLGRWAPDSEEAQKRAQILEKLQGKLLSAQPVEKKVVQYRLYHCKWKIGDVYAYHLSSEYAKENGVQGKYLFFVKVDEETWHPGHTIPVVYFYWVVSSKLLCLDELRTVDYIPQFFVPEAYKQNPQRKVKFSLSLLSTSAGVIPKKQLTFLGNIGKPDRVANEDPNPYAVRWKNFEKYIIENFQTWNDFSPHY